MTILRSGATQKYAENWSKAFGGGKKKSVPVTAKKKSAKKKKTMGKKAKK